MRELTRRTGFPRKRLQFTDHIPKTRKDAARAASSGAALLGAEDLHAWDRIVRRPG